MICRSAFVHAARNMGAGGIWLPISGSLTNPLGIAIDVSGNNRHGLPGNYGGRPWAGAGPDCQPGYDGVNESTTPSTATIPAIADPNTLVAHVHVPTTSESGAFLSITNTTRGNGIGVGNGTSYDGATPGNTFMALNDSVAWHSSATAITVGWHLFSVVFATGASQMFMLIDETLVSTQTYGGLAAGTTTEARIAGTTTSSRATTCIVGTTAWFPRALSVGECQILSRCTRTRRAIAA